MLRAASARVQLSNALQVFGRMSAQHASAAAACAKPAPRLPSMARPLVAAAAWSRPQAAWMLAVTAPGRAQVQARAYAIDAAAAEAGGNAEIDEVDFDPALANMGERTPGGGLT